jgi:hypothetical protein
MHDAAQLRELISEYGRLSDLSGGQVTPQARGIRFNEVVAAMLRCWGIAAEVSTSGKGSGEIDVTFVLDGERYLVEAKWEREKTNVDPLFKLQGRLRQRLRGPIGIFLSMAGFTPDAIEGIDRGDQLGMLLFDRTHFEAMLSGLVPPRELIGLAHDQAAFRGGAYASVLDLLAPRGAEPDVTFIPAADLADHLASPLPVQCDARFLASIPRSADAGVSYGEAETLLVTLPEGIAEVRPSTKKTTWIVPLRGCHRNALPTAGGAIYFARRFGIARIDTDALKIVGGALAENSSLFNHPDGTIWAIDSGSASDASPYIGATQLGPQLGDQATHFLSTRWDPIATDAVWLDSRRLAVAHSNSFSVTDFGNEPSMGFHAGASNCSAVLALDEHRVLVGGGDATSGSLVLTDLSTGRHADLARLGARPALARLSPESQGTILLGSYADSSSPRLAILELEFRPSLFEAADDAFRRSDSGNMDEYAIQVRGISCRDIAMPIVVEPELNRLYNELVSATYTQLGTRIHQIAENASLELFSGNSPGIKGWSPPEYGASASIPRWRLPNTDQSIWMEAVIGFGHRVWPADNLNDLIIVLMVARMTAQTQHTIVTRFAPCTLEDSLFDEKIKALIDDVNTVLPEAFEQFKSL